MVTTSVMQKYPQPPAAEKALKLNVMNWALPLPQRVKVVEVGPRDGLQNESTVIDLEVKIELINRLAETGLQVIESGSFVSAKKVPQMADTGRLLKAISVFPNVTYPVLTPNLRGYQDAVESGARIVSVFAAATEGFSNANLNCSIERSMQMFREVCDAAKRDGVAVRGYVSCVVGCPYDGQVEPEQVRRVCDQLMDMGCYEISLGDTIGVGTAGTVLQMLREVKKSVPVDQLAVHFHDTYGQALANILTALQEGVAVIDSSIAGLGGCPYAHGATGNVPTEDVLYLLNGLGISTGVVLKKAIEVGNYISNKLGRRNNSRVAAAETNRLAHESKYRQRVAAAAAAASTAASTNGTVVPNCGVVEPAVSGRFEASK